MFECNTPKVIADQMASSQLTHFYHLIQINICGELLFRSRFGGFVIVFLVVLTTFVGMVIEVLLFQGDIDMDLLK